MQPAKLITHMRIPVYMGCCVRRAIKPEASGNIVDATEPGTLSKIVSVVVRLPNVWRNCVLK